MNYVIRLCEKGSNDWAYLSDDRDSNGESVTSEPTHAWIADKAEAQKLLDGMAPNAMKAELMPFEEAVKEHGYWDDAAQMIWAVVWARRRHLYDLVIPSTPSPTDAAPKMSKAALRLFNNQTEQVSAALEATTGKTLQTLMLFKFTNQEDRKFFLMFLVLGCLFNRKGYNKKGGEPQSRWPDIPDNINHPCDLESDLWMELAQNEGN